MKEIETIYEFQQINTKETMKEITLNIDNMVCQGCAEKITDVIKDLDGIKKVKTKIMKKLVQVEFNPDKTDELKIETTLTQAGYEPRKSKI
jgi:copper chaperone CopZ